MVSVRKILDILTLIICMGFVFLGFYVYFFKDTSLVMALSGVIFFGCGAIASIISLISKQKSIFSIDSRTLNKKQNLIMAITAFIVGICFLLGIIFFNLALISKILLLVGFLFFTLGSIVLLAKTLVGVDRYRSR